MEEDKKKKGNLTENLVPILLLASVALSFLVGILWQRVTSLEKGITTTQVAGTAADANTAAGTQQAPKATLAQVKDIFKKDVIRFGDENRKVLFIEVADPSCPYCHVASGKNPELNVQADPSGRFKLVSEGGTYLAPVVEMKKLVDEGKASFAYIYTNGHGNGEMGMKALYCANEKGKFWEAHDILMTNNGYNLLNNTVKNDKAKAGDLAEFLKPAVDTSFLKSCLESGKYDDRLTSDSALAQSIGISGTPGFYVNDTNFAGAYSFKDMQSAVDAAL